MGAFAPRKATVLRRLLVPRALFASGILCWAVLAMLFALWPEGSPVSRRVVLEVTSWTAQGFAGVALLVLFARSRSGRRLPLLFGLAVVARYAGDLVWSGVPVGVPV